MSDDKIKIVCKKIQYTFDVNNGQTVIVDVTPPNSCSVLFKGVNVYVSKLYCTTMKDAETVLRNYLRSM